MSTFEERLLVTYYPGSFVSETDERPVSATEIPEQIASQLHFSAFAFAFKTVLRADPIDDGRGGTLEVLPRKLSESGRYYPDGEVFTLVELEALPGDHEILISNVRRYEGQRAVRTRCGNWQPFLPGDVIVSTGKPDGAA